MPQPRRVLAAVTLVVSGALAVPAADAAPPRHPCVAVPTVATTRPSVVRWYALAGGPWVADTRTSAVTMECTVYHANWTGDGPIATAAATTPGPVGVVAGVPFGAAEGSELLVCTRVTHHFAPTRGVVVYDACAVMPA